MAFVAKCAFEHRIGDRHEADTITGKYQESSADALCNAGWLCIAGDRTLNEGFGSGVYNENTFVMTAAEDDTLESANIYAMDNYDCNLVHDGVSGGNYFLGGNTLGLPVPAGRYATFRHIRFNGRDVYRFGIGNFNAALSTNTYATIDDGQLEPAAAAPTSASGLPYFKIVGTGKFTEGTRAGEDYVDVVGYVSVAAADADEEP